MLILSSCMCPYLFQQCVKDCWKLNYFFIHVQQFKTEKVIRHISRSHKVQRQFSISYLCHLKRISNRSGKHTRDRHKDLVKLAKKGDTSLYNKEITKKVLLRTNMSRIKKDLTKQYDTIYLVQTRACVVDHIDTLRMITGQTIEGQISLNLNIIDS